MAVRSPWIMTPPGQRPDDPTRWSRQPTRRRGGGREALMAKVSRNAGVTRAGFSSESGLSGGVGRTLTILRLRLALDQGQQRVGNLVRFQPFPVLDVSLESLGEWHRLRLFA